jgi:hypothetical protein
MYPIRFRWGQVDRQSKALNLLYRASAERKKLDLEEDR